MAIDVNADDFEQVVLKSNVPVLVDFWGPKCTLCLALLPEVEEMEERYGQVVKVVKVDASKNRRFCMTMRVMGLPTFLVYKDGKEVQRLTGASLTFSEIEDAVKNAVG